MRSFRVQVMSGFLLMFLFSRPMLAQSWLDVNGIQGPKVAYEAAGGRILVGTETMGIYYSDDGGITWSQTQLHPSSVSFNSYALYGIQSEVYAFTWCSRNINYFPYYGTNIFHSTDNGISWTRIARDSVIAVAVSHSGKVYGIGVYHEATDQFYQYRYRIFQFNGSHWQPIGSSLPFIAKAFTEEISINFFTIDFQNDFYLGLGGTDLYVSTDEGMTWTQPSLDHNVDQMAVLSSNTIVTAGGAGEGGFFKSTDLGKTWTPLGLIGVGWPRAIAGDSSGNIFVATPDEVYRFLGYYDGWQQVDLPSGLIDWPSWEYGSTDYFYNIESAPLIVTSNGMVLATGKVLGVFRSTDRGISWMPGGPRTRDVFSLLIADSGKIIAGTLGDGVYSSADHGLSWEHTPADSISEYVYSFAKKDTLLYAGTDVGVYSSTDGEHWRGLSQEQVPGSAYAVMVDSTGRIFAGTNFGVYRSTDDGATWVQSGLSSSEVFFLAVGPASHIYAGTKSNGVFSSSDNGASWNPRGVVRDDIEELAVNSSGTVFVGVFGGIVRSTDGGATWKEIDFASSYVDAFALMGSQAVFVGTNEGVYASYDNGAHWKWMNSSGMGETFVLSLAVDNTGTLFAGTYHGGVYKTSQPLTSVETPGAPLGAFHLYQNYPNPFNNSTVIRYSLPTSSQVNLKVYDVLGREVRTLVEERQAAGLQSAFFNASGLSSGIYFFRLTAGTSTEIGKMLFIQ